MTIGQSLIFGVVEGLTEFIPVSSTAHMLLVQRLLGIPSSEAMFSYLVLVQLGGLSALLLYFWREFGLLLKAFFGRPLSSAPNRMAWFILAGTLPALLVGALLRPAVEQLFANPLMEAAIRFLTTAVVLTLAEWFGTRSRTLDSMTWLDSIIIGMAQVLALFPGASRSGAAISGGLLRHFDRASATRFAFLMAAPVMLAAGIYESVVAVARGTVGAVMPALAWGLAVAAVSGWLSIRWLIRFVAAHRLYVFAGYCAFLAAVCLLLQWT
ncbi:MAG TPA: undecaprenyl-diphosphate phosphatase [Anaerolineales bacterium]|nr:undecaprenyl-diphosphate phosphatase [Anaerolineales bacterium]